MPNYFFPIYLQQVPSTPTTPIPEPAVTDQAIKNEVSVKTEDSASNNTPTGNLPNASVPFSPEKKAKFGFPASQAQNYTVGDCRALVKTLVCGVKTITWGLTSTKAEANPALGGAAAVLPNSQFQPKETLVYIRLVKWAMEVSFFYHFNSITSQVQVIASQKSNVQVTLSHLM